MVTDTHQYKAKNCTKGIPCGNACISAGKKCKSKLPSNVSASLDAIADPSNLEEGAETSGATDEALLKDLKEAEPDFVEKWGTAEDEIPDPETGAKILNADAPPPTPEQVANIQGYTAEDYLYINESLRFGGEETWQEKGREVTEALDSIPDKYEGAVYRGTSLPREILEKMEVGGTYADKGLMSTTKNLEIAKTFGEDTQKGAQNTVFIIQSKTGVDVSKVSIYPKEDEVLFGAGKEFAINKMQTSKGILYIGLKEK